MLSLKTSAESEDAETECGGGNKYHQPRGYLLSSLTVEIRGIDIVNWKVKPRRDPRGG